MSMNFSASDENASRNTGDPGAVVTDGSSELNTEPAVSAEPAVAGGASQQVERRTEFRKAADQPSLSLIAEFWLFIREEKKWWLTPIVLVLLLLGVAVFLTSTGAAPFIYTLF